MIALGVRSTVIFIVLCAFALFIHYRKMKSAEHYLGSVFGISKQSNRVNEYDWLRLLAACMVIVTHAVQGDIAAGHVSDSANYIMVVVYMLCLACNPLYVMLSGALLIPYKEEKISDFYLRRASRVLIPMFVYYVYYLWVNHELVDLSPVAIKADLLRFFTGNVSECPHYWLMYVILGLYIMIPFLRGMFRGMPYNNVTALAVLSLVFMYLNNFIANKCAVSPVISSWLGVAVIGYWITREESRKYHKLLIAVGLLAFAYMAYLIKIGADYMVLCTNCSPVMVLVTCGLVAAVFSLRSVFSRGNFVLSLLSKYSFSIILIHWTVVFVIVGGKLGLHVNRFRYIGGTLIVLFATLFISLCMAFVIDNVFVTAATQLYDWFVAGCVKLLRRVYPQKSLSADGN